MNENKKLEVSTGVLAYYLMQHIFRTQVNPRFSRDYLNNFLDGFFKNSELMGYSIVSQSGKTVSVHSDDYPKFLKGTCDMLIFKYAQIVDDFNEEYCISHEFVKPLRMLYETKSVAMENCILNFEAALTYDAYFNHTNLNIIEDEYERQSKKAQDEYEKKQEKDGNFHCMA